MRINEKFDNILDSSVIDYTQHFENEERKKFNPDEKLKDWLYTCIEKCTEDSYEIVPYEKDDIYCINVFGNISILLEEGEDKIPYKFNHVTGNFNCSFCGLTSLENCPDIVDGDFNCSYNNLKNLDHLPIAKTYNLSYNQLNLSSLNRLIDKVAKNERHPRHNLDHKRYENGIDSYKTSRFNINGNPRLIKYKNSVMYKDWFRY